MKYQEGVVKWFDDGKGYGFIKVDDGGGDVFVHHRDIEGEGHKTLKEGDLVKFGITKTDKGFKAVEVKKIESSDNK